jgi:FMN-dependent NADH-azoreductase
MTTANTFQILEVSASGRGSDSVSRMLAQEVIDALEAKNGTIELTRRDLNKGISLVDEDWINANFTADEDRTTEQHAKLGESGAMVAELQHADVIVIGAPIYNFGVPASLKAWVDMIARARLTFRYTAQGPEGLLKGKKAYVVVASGGVPVDSPVDFATPYLRQALKFIGITDVEVIAADRLNENSADSIDAARVRIADLIFTAPSFDDRAA